MRRDRTEIALRLWLTAQLAGSVAANIAGADPTDVARVVAVVAPLVLFGSIESMLWIPGRRDVLGVSRALVTIGIGLGAAVLSFDHIATLGADAGLSEFEQIVLAGLLDGGILVVGLTLMMHRRNVREPEPAAQTTVPRETAAQPAENRSGDAPNRSTALRAVRPAAKLTAAERRPQVRAAFAGGATDLDELADRFGCSRRTIERDLEERAA